jgi:hypothetical protein
MQTPADSTSFLRQRLGQIKPVDHQEIARSIEALDSNRYADREQAMVKLQRMGFQALPALEKVLVGKPPLEVLRRVELLLAKIRQQPVPAEWLQALRALEVLEMLGTPEAVAILEVLARGRSEDWLTQEADNSLNRVRKRTKGEINRAWTNLDRRDFSEFTSLPATPGISPQSAGRASPPRSAR